MSKNRQETSWGYIDWLDDAAFSRGTTVFSGIRTILPGETTPEHILYGDKKLCYTISGTGVHFINGKKTVCRAGDYVTIPLGSIHSEENTGTEEWQQMVVTAPAKFRTETAMHVDQPRRETSPVPPKFIRDTFLSGCARIEKETLNHLRMSVVLTDSGHKAVFSSPLPRICKECTEEGCPLKTPLPNPQQEISSACATVLCPKNLTVLVQPVLFDHNLAGFIKGGLFAENPALFQGTGSLLNEPGSTFHTIRIFLFDMASYLKDYYYDCLMEREIMLQKKEVEEEELYTKAITDAYEKTRDVALNMKVRNHFLFNTLNSIAALAVEDGSMETYRAILNLSDLFRGLLRKEGTRVPLREELDFLNKYLSLQQLRHEGRLKVVWDLSAECSNIIVPHNFLQPVVENSFIHAFSDRAGKDMKITVTTEREDDRVRLTVTDNGIGMDAETLSRLRESIYEPSDHGLSMVNRKLYGLFGLDFTYQIDSEPGRGTVHTFMLPI